MVGVGILCYMLDAGFRNGRNLLEGRGDLRVASVRTLYFLNIYNIYIEKFWFQTVNIHRVVQSINFFWFFV